jgi:hypothetical protein
MVLWLRPSKQPLCTWRQSGGKVDATWLRLGYTSRYRGNVEVRRVTRDVSLLKFTDSTRVVLVLLVARVVRDR